MLLGQVPDSQGDGGAQCVVGVTSDNAEAHVWPRSFHRIGRSVVLTQLQRFERCISGRSRLFPSRALKRWRVLSIVGVGDWCDGAGGRRAAGASGSPPDWVDGEWERVIRPGAWGHLISR